MATLLRAIARQGRAFTLMSTKRCPNIQHVSCISTSKKNKDISVTVDPMQKSEELKKLEEHFAEDNPESAKNWISYGYEITDPDLDRFVHNITMFLGVTLCICWGGFILAYMPDHGSLHWATREAYLEIERREKNGLPLVDPELIPLEKIKSHLPSDEELGDTEIII